MATTAPPAMDLSWLSAEQQQSVQMFSEISQITDVQVALEILEENNWNVDQAVDRLMSGGGSSSSGGSNGGQGSGTGSSDVGMGVASAGLSSRSRSSSSNSNRASAGNNSNNAQVGTVNTRSASNTGNRNRNQQTNPTFEMVLAPLRWLFQTRPVSVNRELDTRKFLAEFDTQYGNQHPTFMEGSYQTAVQRAFQQSKFLLIYIHSPMHEDTPRFCHQVMCTQSFAQFANENFVCWSGRVWDPEAYDLSHQLRASSFPFVALLVCQSERVVQIADRVQGFSEERSLTETLRTTMLAYNEVLVRTRTEVTRREESTMLREQQDREYRESAEAELRERVRREEEQATRAREADEARVRRDQDEAAASAKKNRREIHLKNIRETLPEEPQPAADVAAVRFQLPQGTKLARRFHRDHTAQMIYDYLHLYFAENNIEVTNFMVSTHFPKQNLEDMAATVQDLGLHPRGMLYVQDLDA